ncbi:hypothetical protein V8E36_001044 [Tilletia maclaganii]
MTSLTKARRAKAKKTLTGLTPEQIAANLAAQEKEEDGSARRGNGSEDAKMEGARGSHGAGCKRFVRNLAFKTAAEEPRRMVKTEATEPLLPTASSADAVQVKQEASGTDTVLPSQAASERRVTVQDAPIDEDEQMADEHMERIEVFAVQASGDNAAGEDSDEANEGRGNSPETGHKKQELELRRLENERKRGERSAATLLQG